MLILLWAFFLAASVWGHVGVKLAAQHPSVWGIWGKMVSLYGISGFGAWAASLPLWILILERQSLFAANALSALRYPLVALAAVLFLHEQIRLVQTIGIGFIVVGLLCIAAGA